MNAITEHFNHVTNISSQRWYLYARRVPEIIERAGKHEDIHHAPLRRAEHVKYAGTVKEVRRLQ